MTTLDDIGKLIAQQRKRLHLTQPQLASKARVSLALLAKLETGRYPELGIKKLTRILNAVGLDIRITTLNLKRPTLEDLQAEEAKAT